MENNTSSLMKLTLYDRIFKPQTVTLPNGHSVQRCRSRTPVIVLFLAVAIWLSLRMTGFDLHVVITKFSKMVDLLEKILQPDWSFFPKVVSPLIDTIKMSDSRYGHRLRAGAAGCDSLVEQHQQEHSRRLAHPIPARADPDTADSDHRTRAR